MQPPPLPEEAPGAILEEHRFPCAQCGADVRFDPAAGQLLCDHCGHREAIIASPWAGAKLVELDFDAAVAETLPQNVLEETRVLSCANCAAQVEFDADVHAKECPFCATPIVTDTGPHRHIKPAGVLPFALDESSAHAAMTQWLGRLWFAPSGLKEFARKGRRMQGIYLPYWTFDANTASRYRGERGTIYYETRMVKRGDQRVPERVAKIRWTRKSGRVARFFDDVLVVASKSMPGKFTQGLQGWDLASLEPYRPDYLAGFRAEGYSVALEEGYVQARQMMARRIERDVRFDIGGDQQRVHEIETEVRDVTFKHVLLPIWLAAYKFRGQTYRFVVNGRNGQVQGERPWSAWKITAAVVIGLLVAAGVGYLMATQQG